MGEMIRFSKPGLLLLLGGLACLSEPRPQARRHPNLILAVPDGPDQLMQALVDSFEAGSLSLDSAAKRLADLIEPTGGFVAGPTTNARAETLFKAVGQELYLRDSRSRGWPDSLVRR
jgi:hypothetical protein